MTSVSTKYTIKNFSFNISRTVVIVHVTCTLPFLFFTSHFFTLSVERKIIVAWNAKFPRLIRNTHWNYSLLSYSFYFLSLFIFFLYLMSCCWGNILSEKKQQCVVLCVKGEVKNNKCDGKPFFVIHSSDSLSFLFWRQQWHIREHFRIKNFICIKLGLTLIVWECKSWKRAKSDVCRGIVG